MKHVRLMYNNFTPDNPEYVSLLELWCMIGGAIVFIYVLADSGVGFTGRLRLEILLSLIFPGLFFFLGYLARYRDWMRNLLIATIFLSLLFSGYLYFFPEVKYTHLPCSDMALILFTFVALIISIRRNSHSNYENI